MLDLDIYGTLVAASAVLLLGQLLVTRVPWLAAYTIPEPVAGGLMVALMLLGLRSTFAFEVRFDSSLSAPLMLTFFACIGLNADLASLRRGGRPLMVFLVVVLGFLVLQNVVGLLLALGLGQSPFFGLLAGSIALSGGHGTGVAWGKLFSEQHGIGAATEVALACATFGLVLGAGAVPGSPDPGYGAGGVASVPADPGRVALKPAASVSASLRECRKCRATRAPAACSSRAISAPTRRAAPVTRMTGVIGG